MTTDAWLSLKGKRALVTGGASGIGLAIVQGLLSAGCDAVIIDRDPRTLEIASEASKTAGNGTVATGHIADVRSHKELDLVRSTIEREAGALDIIVPNAGINVRMPFLKISPEQVDEIVDTNLKGVIATVQTFVPMIVGREAARVVVTGSVIAVHGMVLRATYAASKAGISGLVRSLAMEWGPLGVTVNAIGPGVIHTDLIDSYMEDYPDRAEAAVRNTALRRIGTPEEVAAVVVFLASHAARFITGQTIFVDGGLSAGSDWW